MQRFREGIDYVIDGAGNLVMTADYLRRRGHCCGNGCRHCPYDFERVPEPRRRTLLAKRDSHDPTGHRSGVQAVTQPRPRSGL